MKIKLVSTAYTDVPELYVELGRDAGRGDSLSSEMPMWFRSAMSQKSGIPFDLSSSSSMVAPAASSSSSSTASPCLTSSSVGSIAPPTICFRRSYRGAYRSAN